MAILHGSYDLRLVGLSVVLAVFASYAALDFAGRVTSASGRARALWLSGGAAAMGLGIWAMHYVGMLAFTIPMSISYRVTTVMLSLLAAILASGAALFVVSRPKMNLWQEFGGGLVMGCGIAAMHYTGMAAMRCAAIIRYDLRIVILSIALAVAISMVALNLTFRARDERASWRKIISALVMGGAIPIMHYTGMWAASFYPAASVADLGGTVSLSAVGAVAIGAAAATVLAIATTVSSMDRYLTLHRDDLSAVREREVHFRMMAEAIPEIIWTADPDGEDDHFNQKCFDYTGLTLEQMRGNAWKAIVHPDDLEDCWSKWQNALRVGEPYEVEYRLRGKDGNYRWFLGRANPIRNAAGVIVKWFGTCTDIENQKKNQQILEQEILDRTTQLAEANGQLQQEMMERDSARRQLDLQTERMMADLEARSERATMLAKMGELLQSCNSRDEVIEVALSFAPKIFPSARGAVYWMNSSRSSVELIGSWSECQLAATDFETGDCWALRTGQPHLVYYEEPTAKCRHAAELQCSYLCVPILAQGETVGILHLQSKQEATRLDPAELSFRATFAGQVGLSIANIKLRDALRIQSIRDALTGLHNRRYLEETLEREVRRSARARQHLGIILIDLDHFKNFNDTFGHDAGDAVLREAGSLLSKWVRAEDFVCRYGGEEFVVVLPTANLKAAQGRAEALRLKMKELAVVYQGKSMGMITISSGVSAFPEHGKTPKELMAAADAALYEAKRNGRDQVALASAHASEGDASSEPDKSAAATFH